MRKKDIVGHAATAALVVCALVMTSAVVHREFFGEQATPTGITRVPVRNASTLADVGHRVGRTNAPVTLVEFTDFQCPFCRAMDATIRRLRQRHPNDLAVVYRNFPLTSIHPNALPAALAAECAGQQGRFDEYAALLFSKQDSLGALGWETLATRAGVLDAHAFRDCRAASSNPAIAQDTLTGQHIGITGTPAVVVGGKMAVGAIPIDTLEKWITDARRVASR